MELPIPKTTFPITYSWCYAHLNQGKSIMCKPSQEYITLFLNSPEGWRGNLHIPHVTLSFWRDPSTRLWLTARPFQTPFNTTAFNTNSQLFLNLDNIFCTFLNPGLYFLTYISDSAGGTAVHCGHHRSGWCPWNNGKEVPRSEVIKSFF